jgi:hypothetical protein
MEKGNSLTTYLLFDFQFLCPHNSPLDVVDGELKLQKCHYRVPQVYRVRTWSFCMALVSIMIPIYVYCGAQASSITLATCTDSIRIQ